MLTASIIALASAIPLPEWPRQREALPRVVTSLTDHRMTAERIACVLPLPHTLAHKVYNINTTLWRHSGQTELHLCAGMLTTLMARLRDGANISRLQIVEISP